MRTITISLTTLACVFGFTGCVPQRQYDRAQERIRTLNYKLDVAERNLAKNKQDLASLRRDKSNAVEKARMAGQKLAEANSRLAKARDEMTDAEKRMAEWEKSIRDKLAAEYKERFDALKDTMPTVEVSSYGGLVLESGVFFKPGRHELQRAGMSILDPLIAKFKDPEYATYSIEIAGHTDSDPIRRSKSRYRDNHILAANRANEVRRYLIEKGVDPNRVYLSAWGSQRPLFAGAPKSKNRRVEIVVR